MNAKKCSLCEFTINGLEEEKNNSWWVEKKMFWKGQLIFLNLTTHFHLSFNPIFFFFFFGGVGWGNNLVNPDEKTLSSHHFFYVFPSKPNKEKLYISTHSSYPKFSLFPIFTPTKQRVRSICLYKKSLRLCLIVCKIFSECKIFSVVCLCYRKIAWKSIFSVRYCM